MYTNVIRQNNPKSERIEDKPMTIHFSDEYGTLEQIFDFEYEAIAKQVVETVLEQEACPFESTVEIIYTSDEEIHKINMEHRGIDRPTDVLSFPMVDFEQPAEYDFLDTEEGDAYFDPDSGELILGDIVLSIPRIVAQAEEYGHSRKREYAFLIAHSMLHLLGYDHMTEEEAKIMEAKQNQALAMLGIGRDNQ